MASFISATLEGDIGGLSRMGAQLAGTERRATEKAGLIVERAAGRKFTGYQGGRSDSSVIQRRTGALRKSLNSAVHSTAAGYEARVGYRRGAVDKYAALVERGGTVTAKGKVLAIPIGANLTAAGVAKYKSPRDVEDGFWLSRPGRPPVFLRSISKGGKVNRLELLFVGKRSVTVRPRNVLSRSLTEQQPQVVQAFRDEIAKAIKASFGG